MTRDLGTLEALQCATFIPARALDARDPRYFFGSRHECKDFEVRALDRREGVEVEISLFAHASSSRNWFRWV
jgi:hypothetical protein